MIWLTALTPTNGVNEKIIDFFPWKSSPGVEEGQYSHDSDRLYFGILSACINFCTHK